MNKFSNWYMKHQNQAFSGVILACLFFVIMWKVFISPYLTKPITLPGSSTAPTSSVTQQVRSATDVTTNWKTYSNEKYAFLVKYPTDWVVSNSAFSLDPKETTDQGATFGTQTDMQSTLKNATGFVVTVSYFGDQLCSDLNNGVVTEDCPGFILGSMNSYIETAFSSSYTGLSVHQQTVGKSIQGFLISGKLNITQSNSRPNGVYDYRQLLFRNPTGQYFQILTDTNKLNPNNATLFNEIASTFQFTD